MWSDWLVFCDCSFHSVCHLMEKDKQIMEASRWERLTEGESGLVLMGGAMLSKSLIHFSVEGQGCVPSLLFDLKPNYGGGDEDNVDVLQKAPYTHCYAQCPPTLHQATANPHLHQRLLDSHGQVWVSLLWGPCSFLLDPGCTWFCLCPPRICFPSVG